MELEGIKFRKGTTMRPNWFIDWLIYWLIDYDDIFPNFYFPRFRLVVFDDDFTTTTWQRRFDNRDDDDDDDDDAAAVTAHDEPQCN